MKFVAASRITREDECVTSGSTSVTPVGYMMTGYSVRVKKKKTKTMIEGRKAGRQTGGVEERQTGYLAYEDV